jgi:putative GTP pyrophosphokinase
MFRDLQPASFLAKYNLPPDTLSQTGIDWDELVRICNDHENNFEELEIDGLSLSKRISRVENVHSLKIRVKDPEHLAAKIIRKRLKDPERVITRDSYRTEITDLLGLRVLHLFKENWRSIHDFITRNWNLAETPVANVREGDADSLIKMFEDGGCKIHLHPAKYRSVHYLVVMNPSIKQCIAEVQVRTIFEEGWSEIDHRIRYPHNLDNAIINQFLTLFNRVAGQADEMGSFVTFLAATLAEQYNKSGHRHQEIEQARAALDSLVARLPIAQSDRDELGALFTGIAGAVVKLNASSSAPLNTPDDFRSSPPQPAQSEQAQDTDGTTSLASIDITGSTNDSARAEAQAPPAAQITEFSNFLEAYRRAHRRP